MKNILLLIIFGFSGINAFAQSSRDGHGSGGDRLESEILSAMYSIKEWVKYNDQLFNVANTKALVSVIDHSTVSLTYPQNTYLNDQATKATIDAVIAGTIRPLTVTKGQDGTYNWSANGDVIRALIQSEKQENLQIIFENIYILLGTAADYKGDLPVLHKVRVAPTFKLRS